MASLILKKSSAKVHGFLVEVPSEVAVSKGNCREWLHKSKNGEFDFEDKEHNEKTKLREIGNIFLVIFLPNASKELTYRV